MAPANPHLNNPPEPIRSDQKIEGGISDHQPRRISLPEPERPTSNSRQPRHAKPEPPRAVQNPSRAINAKAIQHMQPRHNMRAPSQAKQCAAQGRPVQIRSVSTATAQALARTQRSNSGADTHPRQRPIESSHSARPMHDFFIFTAVALAASCPATTTVAGALEHCTAVDCFATGLGA